MEPRRIVVGVDFSEHSRVAISQAMHVARRFGAELVLVHSCDATGAQLFIADRVIGESELFRKVVQASLRGAHQRLEEEYARWQGQGVELSMTVMDAPPARGLLEAIKEQAADLAVVGSHGRTGVTRFVLGSVAEKVARRAECDVLVSRNRAGEGGFRRLVVPTDLSPFGDSALPAASALAADGAQIDVLHACAVPAVTGWFHSDGVDAAPLVAELEREALREAEERQRHLRGNFRVSVRVTVGPPAAVVDRFVDEARPELVVLASHGRRGWRRALLGSVAEQITRHAACSVFVVRGEPE